MSLSGNFCKSYLLIVDGCQRFYKHDLMSTVSYILSNVTCTSLT